jgi:hypothetical protein
LLENSYENARHAYLTPDPSSQFGFSSSPSLTRRPLSSIIILRPKVTGEPITIGRSSVRCSHPIPQQWLNLHISRVHVVITYLPPSRQISIQCRGVNPISINTPYESHKLERGGIMLFNEREDIKINIAGYVVIVEGPDSSIEEGSETSLPTLSPPISAEKYSEPEKKTTFLQSSPPRTSPTPISERPALQFSPIKHEIQIYQDTSLSPPPSSLSPPPEEEISPPDPLSPYQPTQSVSDSTLLDALLTTLIFAEVKPTSLPRLIGDLTNRLPNTPTEHINSVLTNTPCIGIVHRSGKDAAGKELSDEYYYIPESISLVKLLMR